MMSTELLACLGSERKHTYLKYVAGAITTYRVKMFYRALSLLD